MADPNPKTLPRIDDKVQVKDLKAEAAARGLAVKSTMSKQTLIQLLGLGSIRMSATPEYKYVVKLRQLMENEKQSQIAAQTEAANKAYAIKMEARQKAYATQQDLARKAKEERDQIIQAKLIKINDYSDKQHTLIETNVHVCPLASTKKLIAPQYKETFAEEWKDGILIVENYMGNRFNTSSCDICRQKQCIWACEKCNFDICQSCFELQKLPAADRVKRRDELIKEEAKRKKKAHEEMEREQKRRKKLREKEEKEEQIRETKELEKRIGKLQQKHKVVPKANRKTVGSGYTVWSASGDRWNGPAMKQFDSSWKSLDDATQRAKYVFYVKNCWGSDVSDVENELETNSHYTYGNDEQPRGLFNLQMHDEESNEWTVSVVPDEAFMFLDHVGSSNHHDDNDTESHGYDRCLAY